MFGWLQRLFPAPVPADPVRDAPAGARPTLPPDPAAAPAPAAACAPLQTAPAQSWLSFDQIDSVNGAYYRWLFDTVRESGIDTSALETQVIDALEAIVSSQQSGAALVRRLPGLLPQLLQSLRSDSFSGAQLSRTISNDVVLVAAVIRLANSSVMAGGKSITSVEHAVMLIGQEGLRHLITSVAFRPIIDMNSGRYTRTLAPRIWDQSERCAVADRMLAEEVRLDPFEAFLAGLVQNVGLIVSLRMMDQIAKDGSALGSEMFCASLVRNARLLAVSIAREWNFPDSVVVAIGEQGGMKKGAVISPLGRLLTVSDYLSKVRILVENERVAEADPALFYGLPPHARACYRALDPLGDEQPAAPAASAP